MSGPRKEALRVARLLDHLADDPVAEDGGGVRFDKRALREAARLVRKYGGKMGARIEKAIEGGAK